MEKIFSGLLTILLSIALVYLLVCVACWAWGYVCVSVFGFPMLTKMQMLVLIAELVQIAARLAHHRKHNKRIHTKQQVKNLLLFVCRKLVKL